MILFGPWIFRDFIQRKVTCLPCLKFFPIRRPPTGFPGLLQGAAHGIRFKDYLVTKNIYIELPRVVAVYKRLIQMIADTKLVFVLACTRDWWMKYAREEVYNNFALRSNAFATWILRLFCLGDKGIRIRIKKDSIVFVLRQQQQRWN